MLLHLVMFRPKPDLDDSGRQRLAAALSTAIQQIPSVRRARVGRRVTHGRPYEQLMRVDYTHVAMLEFEDVAGLQAYLEHPAHDQLAARFFEAFEEALMYDYDVADGEEGIRAVSSDS
jgi:hypothetical protein